MAEKDPKDMTASELLRWAANGEPNEYGNVFADFKLLSALSGKPYAKINYAEDVQSIRNFADKIDAEIEAARADVLNTSFFDSLDMFIGINDFPRRHDGEGFTGWMERCFIQRPLDETGEPVQFGEDTDKLHEVEKFIFTRSGDCCQMQDARGNMQNAFPGQRVKRPVPEVQGADGKPIVEGETVYPISGDWIGCPLEVASIDRDGSVRLSLSDGKGWTCYLADRLTHTPPDTQERIDADARKSSYVYWACLGDNCDRCPATIDGKKPNEYFDCTSCMHAKTLDLLRRQRELDARKGGVE